ncbi:MAG: hypothetical protein AAGB02_06095 [Pseudomonadota bacterium]
MREFVFALIFLVSATSGSAMVAGDENLPERWRLVFENDSEGNVVVGSKEALMDAVRSGKPIRIYWAGRRVEHATDAQFLTIFDGEVFAQVSPIDAQRPDVDPARVFFRAPNQKWHAIVGTNGFVTAYIDGNDPNIRSGPARWFAQD